MRNLEDCRAEIFRLGEKKIKERRRRRIRTISVCVPLCLCLVVCGVWLNYLKPPVLNAPLYDSNASTSGVFPDYGNTDNFEQILGDSQFVKYTQVDIKGLNGSSFNYSVKDSDKANLIASIVSGFYDTADGSTGGTDKPLYSNGSPNFALPGAPSSENTDSFVISFITENGIKTEYTLSGRTLKNNSTGERVVLTNEQIDKLFSDLIGGN